MTGILKFDPSNDSAFLCRNRNSDSVSAGNRLPGIFRGVIIPLKKHEMAKRRTLAVTAILLPTIACNIGP
jgi:hypothetical protein